MHGTPTSLQLLSRRHFIVTAATAAGGFMIGIGAAPRAAPALQRSRRSPGTTTTPTAPNEIDAWIAIDPDDSILIRYQRSEMGQGSMTALPMMITEELQCDWSKVRIEYASPNRNLRENKVYGDDVLGRQPIGAGIAEEDAAGRRQRARAPDRRGRGALERSGIGVHGGAERRDAYSLRAARLRYGELAADAAKITLATEPAIKTPAQFTFIPQADAARRRGPQDRRLGQVRHRRASSGHGVRRDHGLPRARRQAQERR